MNDRSDEQIKSGAYEKNARMSIPTYDGLFKMIQSYFRAQFINQDASLLIVGAGGGNELATWGPSNPTWSFTGIDPSEEMLAMAQEKVDTLGLEKRVSLIQGTLNDLPATETMFDGVSCILVLQFIEEYDQKRALLNQIRKRVSSGAPFVLVTAYGDRDSAELQQRIEIWKSFFLDNGFDQTKVNGMGKTIMNLSFTPEDQLIALLKEAGFTNVTRFYSTGLFGGWMCEAD
ncbi:class I SAM-dependent methyltransferase [Shouchella patagoniensis]|uniref:class I SAM-dependent methyltransferase n=1 Tax=Shouchella patagoniensis TaxID=228576 RepID=UPI0009957192|nr:class I SAM-dependent methyltransferase [Shouchella patagoniensis]